MTGCGIGCFKLNLPLLQRAGIQLLTARLHPNKSEKDLLDFFVIKFQSIDSVKQEAITAIYFLS